MEEFTETSGLDREVIVDGLALHPCPLGYVGYGGLCRTISAVELHGSLDDPLVRLLVALGSDPARLLEIIYPAGFERFFEELGALAASDPPLDYEQFERGRAELAAKYNQHFHSEWIPELKEKYNLKVLGE